MTGALGFLGGKYYEKENDSHKNRGLRAAYLGSKRPWAWPSSSAITGECSGEQRFSHFLDMVCAHTHTQVYILDKYNRKIKMRLSQTTLHVSFLFCPVSLFKNEIHWLHWFPTRQWVWKTVMERFQALAQESGVPGFQSQAQPFRISVILSTEI